MNIPRIPSSETKKPLEESSTHSETQDVKTRFSEFLKVTSIDADLKEDSPPSFFEEQEVSDPLASEGAPLLAALSRTTPTTSSVELHPTQGIIGADLSLFFEKMASSLILLHHSGDSQTTITLDHPQFKSSAFFGTQIVIQEFSTAPKVFNVEIISNPQALLTIQKAQEQLLSYFEKGDFGFSINRLDTQLQQESPFFSYDEEQQDSRHSSDQDEDEPS